MSKILSIGTAVPSFKHKQEDILDFMHKVYALDETGRRKLKFLYHKGGIDSRYSVIPDYSLQANNWEFYPATKNLEPFPNLELRMKWYKDYAAPLSLQAINQCIENFSAKKITHLITVSCTGMSAPGLDIELLELLNLPPTTFRTSVNFMGCYAALHALKMADAFCTTDKQANVLIVCTELCTLHFQKENSIDNLTSSMLFADGSAAALISNDKNLAGLQMDSFYSMVSLSGKKDMAWELSSNGFQMTLSSYVADLIEENFDQLTSAALQAANMEKQNITHWCIHPGGRKILEAVHKSLSLTNGQLQNSYDVLKEYGNMSSATILFVLKKIMTRLKENKKERIFMTAFGPGLNMETAILSS